MRSVILLVLCISVFTVAGAQSGTENFLPSGSKYNPAIPDPEQFFGFKTGEYHLTYDGILRYMEMLDRVSDRVHLVRIGESWEKQPLIQLIITSSDNHQNLDKIRRDHLAAMDPGFSGIIRGKDPLVVWLGYSIHGNEPSGANAAPLVAYYLAACENESIIKMLDQTVVLLDPCLNPDGLNRFATFINSRKSLNNNSDPLSFEFQEPWPGGRSNHYWFDLNRDWLLLQHPETRALVSQFHSWMPNVLTDHHEMGSNSTFFFQPGVPTRANPLVPPGNFALTQKIGTYHARALDRTGTLYFTEETFDDYYVGKGSSYPDMHGSIGILFEQAGSRGHLRQTLNGPLSFASTIKNQVTVSLSTLEASMDLKKELQYYMADFFKTALAEGTNSSTRGYVFGDYRDSYRTGMMLDILLKHDIRVQSIDKRSAIKGQFFEPGSSWFVPAEQMQYRLIKSIFEPVFEFSDSTFYDVSTWNLPMAMGIPFEAIGIKDLPAVQNRNTVMTTPAINGTMAGTESSIGYLISGDHYLLHKSLYQILNQNIQVKIATAPFLVDFGQKRISFPSGTLLVPTYNQIITGTDLFFTLSKIVETDGITIYSVPTGYTPDGPDLGSGRFNNLTLPKIMAFSGSGSSSITGEVWHLLDSRFGIPLTLTDIGQIAQRDLNPYTTVIITGSYIIDPATLDKLREWVKKGGVLIGIGPGCSVLAKTGLIKLLPSDEAKENKAIDTGFRPYGKRLEDQAGQSVPGTIFQALVDTTHPLAYGYHRAELQIFREGSAFYKASPDTYENPVILTSNPLLSGYISKNKLESVRNSSSVQRHSLGSGKIILFLDDPLFRGYWAGTHKLFLNALFWGRL